MLFSSPADMRHSPRLYALSESMRSAFARFIKNPIAGPGWPGVGTERFGTMDVAILGDVADIRPSGAVVVEHELLDEKCSLYKPIFEVIAGHPLP
jgi:acetylcholinesterase